MSHKILDKHEILDKHDILGKHEILDTHEILDKHEILDNQNTFEISQNIFHLVDKRSLKKKTPDEGSLFPCGPRPR